MIAARVAWIGLLASGAGGCLLFTDTVNTAPRIRIEGPEQLLRGETGQFQVLVSDDTAGARSFAWGSGSTCPESLAAAEASVAGRDPGAAVTSHGETFAGVQRAAASFCVWVVVGDADGARGFATRPVAMFERSLVLLGPPVVQSRQPVTFTAEYRRRSLDGLPGETPEDPAAIARSSLSWALALDGRCEDAERAARLTRVEPGLTSFRYERAQRAAFCVGVFALDELGIERPAHLMVTSQLIAPPLASIQIAGPRAASVTADTPLGIFSDVRLAAGEKGDFDPEEALTFTWKLTRPDGSSVVPPACPDSRPAGWEVCFAPEQRGAYRAELTVSDGAQSATSAPYPLQVVDRAPCIRNTEPRFSSAPKFFELYDRDRVLKVSEVQDDGDPWPNPGRPTQRAFRWSIRKQGPGMPRFERRVSAIFDSFTIPAREYQPGDRIEVRVEYWDRLDLADPQARDFATRCKPDDPVCELVPGSGCHQWITWTVEYL